MYWNAVDERLISRGELPLSIDFLEGYNIELSVANEGMLASI
jgi:hypothetical protein